MFPCAEMNLLGHDGGTWAGETAYDNTAKTRRLIPALLLNPQHRRPQSTKIAVIMMICCFDGKVARADWPAVGRRPTRRSLFKRGKGARRPPAVSANMFCTLWLVFQAWAVAVEGGVFSASAEALAKPAADNYGVAAGNGPNPGSQPNAEPLSVRLIQLGGSFFIQPVGTQVGRFPLIPVRTVQRAGTFVVGQPDYLNLQELLAQGAAGGTLALFTGLPQGNAGGDPQAAPLNPELFPAATWSNQQRLGAAVGPPRFQRSAEAPVRRRRSPELLTTEEAEEEFSGMDTDEDITE